MSDWTKALNEALLNRGDKIPAGWKTAPQVGKEWKRCRNTTERLLAEMVKSGRIEIKRFKVVCGGFPRAVRHYRVR